MTCRDSLDANSDGSADITNAVALLGYLFLGEEAPAAPFPGCGPAPLGDTLDCASFDTGVCPQGGPISLTSLSPDHGPLNGGTAVVLEGSGFTSGPISVTVCGKELVEMAVLGDTRIEGFIPGGDAPGACDLLVQASADSRTLSGAFRYEGGAARGSMVVLAWNDLGMHCMNQDFSELMILPPFNTLHAQVIGGGGEDPRIIQSGVTIEYTIPNNTHSADKTNFWSYAKDLLGADLAAGVGLTGSALSGTLSPTGDNDWVVTGIPLTPINDQGVEDPYMLASVRVLQGTTEVAHTQAVVPVSWEINCDLCHDTPGISPDTDILRKHNALHGTMLEATKPVTCGNCHGQPALGLAGIPGMPTLSSSMHSAHASRMGPVQAQFGGVVCYACHPGQRTQCLRDVHIARGMTCTSCHGDMEAVGNPSRAPWSDEPRCGSAACHHRSGFEYEQPATLYRNSKGHHQVHCAACHGSPHAITPTVTPRDNLQASSLQGMTGVIRDCTVCHGEQPDESFPHRLSGD